MCELTKRYFSPRLVDYIIVVGCRHPNEQNHITQTPELLRRYPLEDHKDFALPPDVIFFCQPEGCINTSHRRTGFQQITSFVFTLTEKDSNRQRFGICINFYRHFSHRPRSIHSHNQHKPNFNNSSDDTPGKNNHSSIAYEQTETDNNEPKYKRRLKKNTLTSICLISHHPFFTRFRECLLILKRIIDACHERSCLKRRDASTETSDETVWSVLTGQTSVCTSNLVQCEVREIETWILRLLSAPVSIPGKTKISIEVLPNEPSMLFALPDHTRFSLVDFPLHLPLELLGVELCIQILTLIILENKVVFQSRDYNALTMSVLAFVALLYPLEYMFPVIPLLPTCMTGAEQLLLIPTPFIIGVPASFFPYKGMGSKKFDDIWIVDLDSNQIIQPRQADPCFDIPDIEYYTLCNQLKQILSSMSVDRQLISKVDTIASDKSKTSSLATNSSLMYNIDVDAADIATRVAMVRFFNSPNILGNFNEYTRTLRLHPRAVVAFQYSSFVRSRPVKSSFIIRLAKTQAVEYFAEWSLCPENVAFLRVQTGVIDPILIGDKPKWYSESLTPITFDIIRENSTFGEAMKILNLKSLQLEQVQSDESSCDSEDEENEEDDDDASNSCYSSLSDFVYDMRHSGICGEIRDNQTYPENQEKTACVEYSTVFNPPEELLIPDTANKNMNVSQLIIESNVGSNSNMNSKMSSLLDETSRISSELSKTTAEIDSDSSSTAPKIVPKPLSNLKASESEQDSTHLEPSHKVYSLNENSEDGVFSAIPSFFEQMTDEVNSTAAGRVVTNIAKLATDKVSELLTFADMTRPSTSFVNPSSFAVKKNSIGDNSTAIPYDRRSSNSIITNRQREFIRQQSVELKANTHNENQLFLKDIITNVLDGSGIGWLKINRVKKLMEDENYRNFVLSRLNLNLDKKYSEEDDHIEDVKINRATFRGMASILRAVIQGLEATFENNGVGGMASTFQLFEIAHTHYWIKDNTTRHDTSPMSERNSPLVGSRESLAVADSNAIFHSPSVLTNVQAHEENRETISPSAGFAAQIGSIWRESKLAFTRSLASASQATSAFAPNLESLINPKSSISPHQPFHSIFTVSSARSPDDDSKENQSLQQTGSILDTDDINDKFGEQDGDDDDFQNIEIVPDPTVNSNSEVTSNIVISSANKTNNQIRPSSLSLITDKTTKTHINISHISSGTTDDESAVESDSSSRRTSKLNYLDTRTSNQWNNDKIKSGQALYSIMPKSSLSTGYRFRHGTLVKVSGSSSISINDKQYLFEVLVGSSRSHLWDQMQIWEDIFMDAIAQERDIIGLDQGPAETMERYLSLSSSDRRRLEKDEDRLLSVMLHNLIAFMVMMRVSKDEIRRKIRRMLGRCHIGLTMSQQLNELIDNVSLLNGNDIDLRPATSRLLQKQSFTVHWGTDNTGDMLFMEVWDDCIVLRSVLGEVYDRYWFEKLVNMTFCPKTRVICLWRKTESETQLNKFYTKRCRDLYFSIKDAMEKVAARLKGALPDQDIGGEFPIKNMKNGEGGLLRISLEGICLTFEQDKEFIDLNKIRKCTTQKDDIFVLEEFDQITKQIHIHKFKSSMADRICYVILCAFSYLATGRDQQ